MHPDEYCRGRTPASRSSFYFSFLFLPPQQRRAVTALYAFCRQVDDVVDAELEAEEARAKLQWWREEVDRTFDGAPQHPVTTDLVPVIADYSLAREYFHELIDGMEMDVDHAGYPAFKDLALYCYRVASVVGLMVAEIFGYDERQTLKYAHDLGIALQLTNILRDVREDAHRGRIYIPQDELACYCVSEDDLRQGKWSEGMRELLAHQARRAHHYYETAFHKLPETDRFRQRGGIIMAELYRTTLARIEAQGFPVLARRVRLSPLRKFWIAWRTARRESQRHATLARGPG